MTLASYYLQIKLAHVGLVLGSGVLFAVRGAALLAGQPWPMLRPLRWLSVAIDTLLLAAGVTLWSVLGLNPVRDAWLGAKLIALLVYIGLGSFALRRGRTPGQRALYFAAALAVFGFMISIARAHQPLGFLQRWLD
jgi:uncharacterized membrane protein SirB2